MRFRAFVRLPKKLCAHKCCTYSLLAEEHRCLIQVRPAPHDIRKCCFFDHLPLCTLAPSRWGEHFVETQERRLQLLFQQKNISVTPIVSTEVPFRNTLKIMTIHLEHCAQCHTVFTTVERNRVGAKAEQTHRGLRRVCNRVWTSTPESGGRRPPP